MRAIILIVLLFIASLAYAQDEGSGAVNTINVAANEEFIITLYGNATTGYEWKLAAPVDENFVTLVRSKYLPKNMGLVGSGGIWLWTFRALKPGETRIAFKYVRPWEKGALPEDEAEYEILISG